MLKQWLSEEQQRILKEKAISQFSVRRRALVWKVRVLKEVLVYLVISLE